MHILLLTADWAGKTMATRKEIFLTCDHVYVGEQRSVEGRVRSGMRAFETQCGCEKLLLKSRVEVGRRKQAASVYRMDDQSMQLIKR